MKDFLFIAPVYEPKYEVKILDGLLKQTVDSWRLVLIHDGPSREYKNRYARLDKERISYRETSRRYNDFGHTLRRIALTQAERMACRFIVHTNGDNEVMPEFVEEMGKLFKNEKTIFAGCACKHNYYGYNVLQPSLHFGGIDCCQVAARVDAALGVGWPSTERASDWTYIEKLLKTYGEQSWATTDKVLAIHH